MPPSPFNLLLAIIDLGGGSGVYCRLLAEGLKGCFPGEFRVSLLVWRDRHLLDSDRTLFDQIHVLRCAVNEDWRRLTGTAANTWRLRRALSGIESDAILTVGTYANLLVPFAAPRRRVLLSEHIHPTRRLREARAGRMLRTLMRLRYPGRTVICPSRGIADDLRANFAVHETPVIPHGVNAARVRQLAAEPAPDLAVGKPYFVACGRLTPQKDYPTLLRAHAAARAGGLAQDLVVLGDGPDLDALRSLAASLDLAPHVRFLGHRDNPFPYVAGADFLALSSIFEGFGLVLIEAMALGVPCVATDCPSGPAEILGGGEYGLLVPPASPAALGEALVRFACSPELREGYRTQSLRRAGELSLQRMATRYRELLLQSS